MNISSQIYLHNKNEVLLLKHKKKEFFSKNRLAQTNTHIEIDN